ncbi:MAG: hypothetical protein ACX93O_05830 [Flagellimonas sp.]
MKKSYSIFLILATILASCTEDPDTVDLQTVNSRFTVFKEAFPELAKNINTDYLQDFSSYREKPNLTGKGDATEIDAITFPVMKEEKVIGRYYGLVDESSAIYIDYSDYQNKIVIYDVNNPSAFQTLKPDLKSKFGGYTTETTSKGGLCAVGCGLAAAAIIASDGPAPFMDFVAVSYLAVCLADCEESFDL